MPSDGFNYGLMVEEALRGVVRTALREVAAFGLVDPHYFYISFRTHAPGVEIPDYLRHQYPEEMTIVLQHQFWDLAVDESAFVVTLSFNRVPERMKIPLQAVTSFSDPGVEFGLQFRGASAPESTATPASPHAIPQTPIAPDTERLEHGAAEEDESEGETPDRKSGEVVTLDAFRKKQ